MRRLRKGAILAATIGVVVSQGANAEDRGKEVFDGLCNRCHGAEGQGNNAENIKAPLIAGMPAWYVQKQLEGFRAGLRGKHPNDDPGMRMRPMARTLNEADLPAISAYVAKLPAQTAAPTLEGADAVKGKAAFAMCQGCHGADAKGMQAMGAPALAGQSDWYLFTQLHNIKAGVRSVPMMQGFVAGLDEASMRNLAAYLHSLPSH
jgi:cbb3-type cytochrome c oxidase subunit III